MQKATTMTPKKIDRKTHTIDATGRVLGRMASEIAQLLTGKGKTDFAPNLDIGDFVHVTNAGKVKLTGKKKEQKVYKHHTRFLGGLKETPFKRLQNTRPEEIVRRAVINMLPHTRLRSVRIKRLKITV